MNVINTYLYTQNLVAVTTDERVGNTLTMYFTPNVKIYRGVDQTVRIQFKNRDNKAVSTLGKTAKFTLVDKDLGITLLEKTIESIDAAKGTGRVRFLESDLVNLDAKYYTYAIRITDGEGVTNPAYADDNYGADGVLELDEGVYPLFTASITEDFDGGDTGDAIYLRPHINRNDAVHTAQVYFSSAFTGTLEVQVSLNPQTQALNQDDWTTLKTINYTAQEDNDVVNWNGVYSAVRFVRSTTSGTLNQILYRP
jgi:hypothetical protein